MGRKGGIKEMVNVQNLSLFFEKAYLGINMKRHLTVGIQVGVNERENWHLGASLESKERTDLYREKKKVWQAWKAKMDFYKKRKQHY